MNRVRPGITPEPETFNGTLGDSPQNWQSFLNHLVQQTGARGGGIWVHDGQQFRSMAALGISPLQAIASQEVVEKMSSLLSEILATRRGGAFDIPADRADPTVGAHFQSAVPLITDDRVFGFARFVHDASHSPQTIQGQLQFLEQTCRSIQFASASAPVVSGNVQPMPASLPTNVIRPPNDSAPRNPTIEMNLDQASSGTVTETDWKMVVACLREIQRHRRLKDVCNAIANECRLLFDVDRISVAVPYGRKVKIISVSGQDRVQNRSGLVKAMSNFTRLILATGEPFQFHGGMSDIPPQLERPLSKFVELGGARMLAVIPLVMTSTDPTAGLDSDLADRKRRKPKVQGGLIVEQMQKSDPQPRLVAHLDVVRDQITVALNHARAYDAIFLLPLWSALGRYWAALRGRKLALAVTLVTLFTVALLAMFFVPWDYRVEAQGQLMPSRQSDVFAPWDGQVVELLARSGDRVASGQILARLRNDELATELAKMRGSVGEKKKLVSSLFAQIDESERTAQRDEETRLRGKVSETQIELDGLIERFAILSERMELLTVRSPLSGVVTTFQAELMLNNRPVQRGDLLLQIMDDHGDWRLELDVPEYRLGHILAARERGVAELPVVFRLFTHPEHSHEASLSEIGSRSVTSEERGSVIEVRAKLDVVSIDHPSIGAKVRARIDCGKKPLGYCLFGDVLEFVQKYLWW